MKSLVRYKEFFGLIFFCLLFFFNIGSKEIFRVFFEEKVITSLVIIILFGLYIIVLRKNQPIIISYVFILYIYLVFRSIPSEEIGYGFEKATLGLIFPLFCFLLFQSQKWNEEILKKYFKIVIFAITIVAIVFKFKNGFFQRSVSFGLLGSITFGWLCGMAFLIPIFEKKKTKMDFFQMIYFFVMVLWSASKGPILSVLLIMLYYLRKIIFVNIRSVITLIIFFLFSFLVINTYLEDIRSVRMFIELFYSPEDYLEGAGNGSFGSRLSYYKNSWILFMKNPLIGVGFGNWGSSNIYTDHKYPHNIILEILSEVGIIGLLLLSLLIGKIWSAKNIFGIIGTYGLISLQFSGDFSYLRYALLPYLISYHLIKVKEQL